MAGSHKWTLDANIVWRTCGMNEGGEHGRWPLGAPPLAIDVEYCHRLQPPAILHAAKDNQLVGIGQEAASLPAAPARYLTRHCVTKGGGGGGGMWIAQMVQITLSKGSNRGNCLFWSGGAMYVGGIQTLNSPVGGYHNSTIRDGEKRI